MNIRLILIALAAILVGACAHHKNVRPGVDGVHRVAIQTDDVDGATEDAIEQANHYCKQKKQEAAFMDESSKYTGDMKEEDYRNAKRVTTVAKHVGGAVWVFGGKRESTLGGLAGIGGAAADSALGKGYTVEMRFKCQ